MPFGIDLPTDRLVASVRRTVPPEWVQAQVEDALDEVTPYIAGERDTFEINSRTVERAEVALEEVKRLLREVEVYDLLYDEVVGPALEDNLGEAVELPFGISVTKDEVLGALRRVAPSYWVQEQVEIVIDQASPYVTGKTDTLTLSISIADNKREARAVIAETVRSKFGQAVAQLPECTADQTLSELVSGISSGLPECIPPGILPQTMVERAGDVVADAVDSFVLGLIPNNIRFTDSTLRQTLEQAGAAENIELLDDVRELIRDGWTYKDSDLRGDLREGFSDPADGDEAVEALDDILAFLADGWTYTERDFREDLTEATNEATLEDFDDGRDILVSIHKWRLLIYLAALILLATFLAIIGFLGGRHWSSRIAWAAAALVVTSGIIFVASWPVYNAVGKPSLDDEQETAIAKIEFDSDFENTERLATEKGFDILKSVVNGFASGVAAKSLTALIVGVIALVVSLRWGNVKTLFGGLKTRVTERDEVTQLVRRLKPRLPESWLPRGLRRGT